MKKPIDLQALLSQTSDKNQRMTSFALLSLGIIESLESGTNSASDVVALFFHADNCLFVRKKLQQKNSDRIMSHGVQLQDLFNTLPAEQAQQAFQRELAQMHDLCLELLDRYRIAA